MPSKQLPASIRYLKVRLKVLQRPTVWVSSAVLLAAIVLLSETWNQSDRFTAPNQPASRRVTPANPEQANIPVRPAPLDPLSSAEEPLFGGTNTQDPSSLSTGEFGDTSQPDQLASPLLLPSGISRRSSSPSRSTTSAPLAPDPFTSVRPDNGASSGFSSGAATPNPYSSSGFSSSSTPLTGNSQPAASPSPSPLQSAIDGYGSSTTAQPSPSSPSSLSSAGTNPAGTAPGLQTPAVASPGQSSFVQPQPLPGQPSFGQTQPQPQFVPQTSPAPGTTGYTLPPAFRTNANTPAGPSFGNYNSNQSATPATIFPSATQPGASNSTAQPQGFQPQASPAPFSVPRTAPGQSIGGGQINTFSNP